MLRAAQVRGARAMLALSQTELADRAGVARRTIIRLENEEKATHAAGLTAIREALEREGARFAEAADGSFTVTMLPFATVGTVKRLGQKTRRTGGGPTDSD